MLIDLFSESCEEGGGKGGTSLLGNEDEPYFEDKFVQISLNFWLSFTSYFSQDKFIGLGMLLFYARKLFSNDN